MNRTEPESLPSCPCSDCQLDPHSQAAEQHRAIHRLVASVDERCRRLVVGFLAQQYGRGGIARLMEITRMSRDTIRRGQRELVNPAHEVASRVRRRGGGRKPVGKAPRMAESHGEDRSFESTRDRSR
jgi:hypothetical protein